MTEEKENLTANLADIDADQDEAQVVVIKDDAGNEYYYYEEMVIPVGEKSFAILVGFDPDEECEDEACSCHDHAADKDDEDENVIIARIEFDADGEPTYVGPTDEEFEAVKAAYAEMFEDEDAKDE